MLSIKQSVVLIFCAKLNPLLLTYFPSVTIEFWDNRIHITKSTRQKPPRKSGWCFTISCTRQAKQLLRWRPIPPAPTAHDAVVQLFSNRDQVPNRADKQVTNQIELNQQKSQGRAGWRKDISVQIDTSSAVDKWCWSSQLAKKKKKRGESYLVVMISKCIMLPDCLPNCHYLFACQRHFWCSW